MQIFCYLTKTSLTQLNTTPVSSNDQDMELRERAIAIDPEMLTIDVSENYYSIWQLLLAPAASARFCDGMGLALQDSDWLSLIHEDTARGNSRYTSGKVSRRLFQEGFHRQQWSVFLSDNKNITAALDLTSCQFVSAIENLKRWMVAKYIENLRRSYLQSLQN